MRVFIGVLACIGIGAASVSMADPAEAPKSATPAATTAAPAAPTSAATPATPAAPGVTVTTNAPSEAQEQLERHFLSEGYKSEMHGSQKVFCRREDTIGTRLGASKNCGTIDQLKQQEDLAAQAAHSVQRTSQRPGS